MFMDAPVFSHISLNCLDPAAIERFYCRHFGFRRARVIPLDGPGKVGGDQIVFLKSGSAYLELFKTTEGTARSAEKDGPAVPGVRHIAFKVENVDSVLKQMGAEARVTLGPLDFDDFIKGWRTVWLADPEGNVVEISQGYTDQANPPPMA
jgi:glyoxylase I family protein